MSLDEARAGQSLKISSLPDGMLYAQFVRLGINEGQRVRCLERLPGGTIILQKNRQQIAIGHSLAKHIVVVPAEDEKG
ncbi:MAG TPA: ferrous iron transport protein A [Bacteroidota bacterium]|nr:ferrous iron transport protein A [Bacteroidota bacterium]